MLLVSWCCYGLVGLGLGFVDCARCLLELCCLALGYVRDCVVWVNLVQLMVAVASCFVVAVFWVFVVDWW